MHLEVFYVIQITISHSILRIETRLPRHTPTAVDMRSRRYSLIPWGAFLTWPGVDRDLNGSVPMNTAYLLIVN
jgi:hypothetical protein